MLKGFFNLLIINKLNCNFKNNIYKLDIKKSETKIPDFL